MGRRVAAFIAYQSARSARSLPSVTAKVYEPGGSFDERIKETAARYVGRKAASIQQRLRPSRAIIGTRLLSA